MHPDVHICGFGPFGPGSVISHRAGIDPKVTVKLTDDNLEMIDRLRDGLDLSVSDWLNGPRNFHVRDLQRRSEWPPG